MEMDITYADTSPPCPSCAVLQRKLADGSVMLNDQAQTIEALHARCEVLEEVVEEIKRLREAVIEAGKEVGYERPVDAYETGVNAGVDSVLKFIYRRAKVSP
jgi:hypothetical protein